MGEPEAPDVPLLVALYLLEAFALFAIVSAHQRAEETALSTWTEPHVRRFVAGSAGAAIAAAFVAARYLRARPGRTARFWMTAGLNAVTVLLLCASCEIGVRVLSQDGPAGRVFMGTPLLPRDWSEVVAHNKGLLAHRPPNISYFVSDELLGWTVGPSRQSTDGLYASSAEGLRAARPGVTLSTRTGTTRVALVGDSYTFGMEVPFESSWAHLIEEPLGSGVQVLNFGVDGYGVDQSYLRYGRDVRPWHPDLVVFGFINHDFYRTMAVYPFIDFPEWGFPFAKPRFASDPGRALAPLNLPVLSSDAIMAKNRVSDLPYLAYDRGYRADDWRRRWYHGSFLVRLLLSRFAPDPGLTSEVSDEARVSLSARILEALLADATREGGKVILVFFPSRADFEPNGRQTTPHQRVKAAVFSALEQKGIPVVDLTSCLTTTPISKMFIEGRPHYSPAGNAAVAACVMPILEKELAQVSPDPAAPAR